MDEQSDAPKSPVGRDFDSKFFGGDWVIAVVRCSMRRLLLHLACLLGSAVGALLGVVAGVTLDSALLAWASAAAFPVLALVLAGIRQSGQLAKIAGYALLGWGLCFVLEPAVQQIAAHRALRIAADPLVGKGWYIPCHITSWVLASVGVAFLPSQPRTNGCTRGGDRVG